MTDKPKPPRLKSIYVPVATHERLLDFQEQQRAATGKRPTIRGAIGLLLDKEALYRERLKRLNKIASNNPEYGHAYSIMAGEED